MKNKIKKIQELLDDNKVELVDYIENYIDDADEIKDFDTLYDTLLEKGAFDHDVIYFHTAMEYLKENDPSLQDSLELAYGFGITLDPKNRLTSETLATILKQENERQNFLGLESEINDIL